MVTLPYYDLAFSFVIMSLFLQDKYAKIMCMPGVYLHKLISFISV